MMLSITVFGCGRPRLDKPALNDLASDQLDAIQMHSLE